MDRTARPWLRLFIGGVVAIALVLGLVVWLAPRATLSAVQASLLPRSSTVAPSDTGSDSAALEAFFDELISSQIAHLHIPGATVAVVHNGAIVFEKGYGWANVQQRLPVVADKTLFHIGSTSKLFTWTAVMQLAE